MLKYTTLIQQIECLMDDPTAAPMERIAELASEYSEACEWVNENVLFCVNTLRQGNASEALRLCRKLDLLENYKTLVFDDYDAWLSAALTFGDVAIPPFNRRLIDELDAAQVCMRPIEEVLKSHRILALSHSPLSVRIPVLRRLVQLDPRNTGWKNELRDYETARLEMIYDELSNQLDYNDCVRLLKEIEGSKWSVEIPVKIKKRIGAIRQEYQQKNRQKQMDQLNAKLNETADLLFQAYNNYDFEGAKRLRSSWLNVLNEFQNLQIIPPYDLLHSVDDVLSWIDSEQEGQNLLQEYNSKVKAVDRELKRSMSVEKCQRLILDLSRSADAIGQPVPERFQRFLDKLIANEERKAKQHTRFVTSIVIVVLFAVLAAIGFGVYEFIQWYRFNSLLENLSRYQLEVSKDLNVLPEAYQFVQNLESSGYQLASYPEVQKNIAYIKKLYEDDKVRHEDWKLLHDKIERSIKREEPSDLEEIKELEKLSVLKEEKETFTELKKANAILLSDSVNAFVKKQNEKFKEIKQAAEALLKSDESGNVVKLHEIESQILKIKQLFADYAFSNPDIQKDAQLFETKCAELLTSIQNAIQKSNSDSSLSEDLEKLASKIRSKKDYAQALQSIIDKNENSSYAADFKVVVQEQESWGKAFDWNEYVEQNQDVFNGGASRTVAKLKDFIAQWDEMSFKPEELPVIKKINVRLPYFQSIIDCNPTESLKPLKDLCYLYSRAEFWYYESSEGKRYYFNKKPETEKGPPRFNYMDSVSSVSENRITVEKSNPVDPLNNRIFCQKVANLLGMINDNTKFTECGIRILDVINQDTSLNDPAIKCQFMMTALDCFTQSDKIMQKLFGPYAEQLDSADVKNGNPFSPDNGAAIRVEANRMLGRLKDFDKNIDEAQKRNQQLVQSIPVEKFQPVGWLDKDGSQWIVRGIPSSVEGVLYVVNQTNAVSVGTVKNKEVKLKAIPDGKRGTPIFMIKTLNQ